MGRYVALLRGVNVGGRTLKMDALRDIVAAAGGRDVATYIQSGNVVLTHRARSTAKVAAALETAIEEATEMEVAVMVRTRPELDAVVASNPFPDAGGTTLHVVFLAEAPPAGALDALDLDAFAPEQLALVGRELYLHLPNGMGRAELPKAVEKVGPPTKGTARNWNTVLKLQEMLAAPT
jgi:uncharacterized protein (DUF1697 family)